MNTYAKAGVIFLGLLLASVAIAKGPTNRATGTIWMGSPSQQMVFNAFDFGPNSDSDRGQVEYSNFDYPTVGAVDYLHYTAPVVCATVDDVNMNTRFLFQIPAGWPGLSGLWVVSVVHDGGTPGTEGDTYGHGASWDYATAKAWCETGSGFAPATYPITAGNLVVHTY